MTRTLDVREARDLARYVDHTLLAPGAAASDVQRLCAEAREHGFAAVCVRREWAPLAHRLLAGTPVRIAVVVDFHEGAGTAAERAAEAAAAVRDGAEELDLVAPLPALRAGRFAPAFEDLRAVIAAVPVPVKVILETAVLGQDQKVAAAAIALAAGAAFLKTSTGFGGGGATVEDVALLRAVAGDRAGVKASGGIRTTADALAMLRAGASRIGTSNGVAIVTGRMPVAGE
ncbi:MAG TPA: deoxyribose-phosphate aldolase [Anaeromyxobacteraceae bacterium]|nr:deoxyribose-phosphate aldolase [Anaeromyxobacteraceae bacterium]